MQFISNKPRFHGNSYAICGLLWDKADIPTNLVPPSTTTERQAGNSTPDLQKKRRPAPECAAARSVRWRLICYVMPSSVIVTLPSSSVTE